MKSIKLLRYLSAIILILFGLLTFFLSTSILLDLFGIRAREGNYVLFIIWANWICSILYLFSAYGFLRMKSWTKILLSIASLILIVSLVGLKVHISNGGLYETKTMSAVIFRTSLTVTLTLLAYFTLKTSKLKSLY